MRRQDNRTAAELLREMKRAERELDHACARAEEIGDRRVPPELEDVKREIIDRYNDEIYALSQRRWELGQQIDRMYAEEGSVWS